VKTKTKPAPAPARARPADLHASVTVLMTRKDVCAALRVSERTLAELFADPVRPFPRGRRFGRIRQLRWTAADVNAWVAAAQEGGGE
jgi:predicted DNA-binding transcriptional regulator AlpA